VGVGANFLVVGGRWWGWAACKMTVRSEDPCNADDARVLVLIATAR
jgi:hypothetical protein